MLSDELWFILNSPGFPFKDISVRKPWKAGEIETSWFPADDLYVIGHESNPSRSIKSKQDNIEVERDY